MGSLTLMRMMRNMTVLSGALFFVLLTFPVSAQVRDTVIVTDTSRYVGQFPEGRGVLYSYGNGLYVGEFRNAVPEGKGMHFLPDGSIYAGELSDGKHCGFGRFFSDSGKIFSGELKKQDLTYINFFLVVLLLRNNRADYDEKCLK